MHQTRSVKGQATETELGTVAGTSDSDWAGFGSAQQATVTLDAAGRTTRSVLSAGGTTYGVTEYSFDAAGRPDCVAVRMNPSAWGTATAACTAQTAGSNGPDRITRTTYDDAGRPLTSVSAYGVSGVQSTEATVSYTGNGKVATATDAEGNKTSYDYDGVDRLVKIKYPNTTKGAGTSSTTDYEQLTYDAGGNVTSRRLRDGNSIGYAYDALNRLTAKDLPGSELDVAYTYDLTGNPLSAATSAQTVTLTYDALGRNLTQVGPQGTVTSAYDLAGRRTQLTYPGSFYVTYDYDTAGNMTAIKESGSTTLATYAYDDLGRRTTLTLGNGVVSSYGFDSVSRLTSLGLNLSGTGDDQTLGFSYNPASQIAGTTRSNDGYAWTGAANVTRAYTSNGLNQFTASGATSLGYDTRGNLTTSGSDTYTYSSENLLLTGPGSAALSYDPLLRLYQTSATGFTTTRFAYDGDQMIAEYNSSNALQKRYVFGPGSDAPLVEYDGSGAKTYLTADERGSIVARTNSSGVATAKNSYDEYGIPGVGNAGRFGYTGQAWLPELGMQYSKARIYSPTLGRFMQTDPIGYGDGMNWYNYVGGDPINTTDPSGLEEVTPDIIVTGPRQPVDIGFVGGSGSPYSPRSQCGMFTATVELTDACTGITGVNIFKFLSLGHEYIENNQICRRQLNYKEKVEVLSRFAAPGHDGEKQSDGIYVVYTEDIPGGLVNVRFSNNGLTVTNTTTPLHAFVGFIRRDIYDINGGTNILTRGGGYAGSDTLGIIRDKANEIGGPMIFNRMDRSAADFAKNNFAGC